MKNPLKHLNALAPLALMRSALFGVSSHVTRKSVSTDYLGLCSYIHAFSRISLEKGTTITFDESGFLALGTERSSFVGWAGRTSLLMLKNSRLSINGHFNVGRGSLVWMLENSEVVLNDNTFTAGKNMIIAKERVYIGRGCAIAWGVTICDHDFHKTYRGGKQQVETAPVMINDNVWIGMNATILKGVNIGTGAVVAAGALVTKDVPSRAVVAGNPAKVVATDIDFRG